MKYLKLRPQFIRILGRGYKVSYVPPSELGQINLGQCNNSFLMIDVAEGQHPVEEADTLLHEILHGIWFVMSASMGGADEEQIVRRMATGLIGVMMDNPHLLKYLQEVQKVTNE